MGLLAPMGLLAWDISWTYLQGSQPRPFFLCLLLLGASRRRRLAARVCRRSAGDPPRARKAVWRPRHARRAGGSAAHAAGGAVGRGRRRPRAAAGTSSAGEAGMEEGYSRQGRTCSGGRPRHIACMQLHLCLRMLLCLLRPPPLPPPPPAGPRLDPLHLLPACLPQLHGRLAAEVRACFRELQESVPREAAKGVPPEGTVHPLCASTMVLLRRTLAYRSALPLLFGPEGEGELAASTPAEAAPRRPARPPRWRSCSRTCKGLHPASPDRRRLVNSCCSGRRRGVPCGPCRRGTAA